MPFYLKIAIPTGGALLVGLIVYFFAPEAKGHGVPEVMEAMALRDGGSVRGWLWPSFWPHRSVSPQEALSDAKGRLFRSALQSVSTVGQFLKVNAQRTKVFVACGAGGRDCGPPLMRRWRGLSLVSRSSWLILGWLSLARLSSLR